MTRSNDRQLVRAAGPAPDGCGAAGAAEAEFYGCYGWCLNPVLSVRELFERLEEELERSARWQAAWQRAESRINVYLFTCAIACTVDDYLARPVRNPTRYLKALPPRVLALLSGGLEAAHARRTSWADRAVVRWRRRWTQCVDLACESLAGAADPAGAATSALRRGVAALTRQRLPARLLRQRMAVPAAFRDHDLTHHDAVALARRFAARHSDPPGPVAVIGVRTAGFYLAALVGAHLRSVGWRAVTWLGMRPSRRLPRWEEQALRALPADAHVIVVDEFPRTGRTFRLAVAALADVGIPAARITILAPLHPSRPSWSLGDASGRTSAPAVVTLEPEALHKARWLASDAVGGLLREYYGSTGPLARPLETEPAPAEINALLETSRARYVRLKRAYRVRVAGGDAVPVVKCVVAKSVGWGWLGYHAYLAGMRLAGFVPPVVGLRQGLLWTEWVEGTAGAPSGGAVPPPPDAPRADLARSLAAYVARRATSLRLGEDPYLADLDHEFTGWVLLLQVLRRVYRFRVGRLKQAVLHQWLRRYAAPLPTLVDGRMRRPEWVATPGAQCKTDFEHHNFGGNELNVVDPAYDLAGASFEFQLGEGAEAALVAAYVRGTGDQDVARRLPLCKLLYGLFTMRQAVAAGIHGPADEPLNQRYQMARLFVVSELHRHCATRLRDRSGVPASRQVVFLDLDGVFDSSVLGFPHTSEGGLVALATLQAAGYVIVLNTVRSVADVRHYARVYGLAGGLAENGSVFYDAARDREWPLLTDRARAQLTRCREALRQLPGVFLDPTYRYAIRAYRYQDDDTIAPASAELAPLLACPGLGELAVSATLGDALVAARDVDKGRGMVAAHERLGLQGVPAAAIGDSDRDVPMLLAAARAYAPANCSPAVRALGREGKCRIMRAPAQRGLLAAVRHLVAHGAEAAAFLHPRQLLRPPGDDLLAAALRALDRTRLEEWCAVLDWRRL
ncbi:MAG TPA: HAD hydrolase family protein [Gemmatimonadales bacterium]|nr:HAD hydrolase family protein [Gemmatimonadales bacterium]